MGLVAAPARRVATGGSRRLGGVTARARRRAGGRVGVAVAGEAGGVTVSGVRRRRHRPRLRRDSGMTAGARRRALRRGRLHAWKPDVVRGVTRRARDALRVGGPGVTSRARRRSGRRGDSSSSVRCMAPRARRRGAALRPCRRVRRADVRMARRARRLGSRATRVRIVTRRARGVGLRRHGACWLVPCVTSRARALRGDSVPPVLRVRRMTGRTGRVRVRGLLPRVAARARRRGDGARIVRHVARDAGIVRGHLRGAGRPSSLGVTRRAGVSRRRCGLVRRVAQRARRRARAGSVARLHRRMARHAVRHAQASPLLRVDVVARRTCCGRLDVARERARVTARARRPFCPAVGSSGERVAGEAGRRRRGRSLVRVRCCLRVAAAARAIPWLRRERSRVTVAGRARDQAPLRMHFVHRGHARRAPRRGDVLRRRCERLTPRHEERERGGRRQRDEEQEEQTSPRHGRPWHALHGSSRRGSSALAKPRPCGFPPGPPTRWHPTHSASPLPP